MIVVNFTVQLYYAALGKTVTRASERFIATKQIQLPMAPAPFLRAAGHVFVVARDAMLDAETGELHARLVETEIKGNLLDRLQSAGWKIEKD